VNDVSISNALTDLHLLASVTCQKSQRSNWICYSYVYNTVGLYADKNSTTTSSNEGSLHTDHVHRRATQSRRHHSVLQEPCETKISCTHYNNVKWS